MQSTIEDVAIFWDYENCHASAQTSGYEVAAGIRNAAHRFGTVKHFKAYMETPDSDTVRSLGLRSELQSSGVSLTDCPHNGRKNVADQMIMVDMLAYALDHGPPATLILISGDRDFAYAVSVLRLRRYQVVVISLPMPGAHISLKSQASVCLDWNVDVMGFPNSSSSVADSPAAVRSPSGSVQSPIARRASLLSGPESQYFKVGQPALKSVASPATVSNSPSESTSTPLRAVPSKEAVTAHPPIEPVEPEVACVPAPAYSPKFDPIPTSPNLGPAAATPVVSNITSIQSQSSAGQSWVRPVSPPPALFSEDHVTAHIQRCMDMELEVEVQPSTSRIPTPPPADVDTPAALTLPILASPPVAVMEANDRISTEVPPPPKAVPPKAVPPGFELLLEILEKHRAKGISRPLRSTISFELYGRDKKVYKEAGVEKWAQYAALAVKAQIIELGGIHGEAWISLHSDWCTSKCNTAEESGQVPVASPTALLSDESISVHIQRCTENTVPSESFRNPTMLPVKPDVPPAPASAPSPVKMADRTPSRQTLLAAFKPLVDILEKYKAQGAERPLRSAVGYELFALAKTVYKEAGTANFSQLTALAEKANVVKLGGSDGRAWISLHPDWNNRK